MASFTAAGERRCAQSLADDAEAGTIARYQRAREVARLITDVVARADARARLEAALRGTAPWRPR
jgi:hypothetical protein